MEKRLTGVLVEGTQIDSAQLEVSVEISEPVMIPMLERLEAPLMSS